MPDLDTRLRAVARAMVEEAPAPPPMPAVVPALAIPARRLYLRWAVAAGSAAAVCGAAVVVVLVRDDSATIIDARPAAEGGAPACGGVDDLPLRVSVPDAAASGPVHGPAPGRAPADAGQLVVHWRRADGVVELRWPAPPKAVYGSGDGGAAAGGAAVAALAAGTTTSPEHTIIDVQAAGGLSSSRADAASADVVVERRADGAVATPTLAPPCDVLELAVVTSAGEWSSGLRPLPPREGAHLSAPYEPVDLRPLIVELRAVDAEPAAAVHCDAPDGIATPPNRSGGADPAMRGDAPADVLEQWIAAHPGSQTSGYVEFAEPDGSITYGVPTPSGGWTPLVFVERGSDGWQLAGWTTSGC